MHLACGIIAFARQYSKLPLLFPYELELMTGVELLEIKSILNLIEFRYNECFPSDSNKRQQSQTKVASTNQVSIDNRVKSTILANN
jgi:hypothetical protein